MKTRYRTILLIFMLLAAVQAACNMPTAPASGTSGTVFPTFQVTPNLGQPGATSAPGGAPVDQGDCTYAMSFIDDVTVPDDTVVRPGASFVKTWRIRNDGTCTWGPGGYPLHALAFTGGEKLSAPDLVPLPGNVGPGQTVDLSVTMVAPAQAGTYTSQWKLKIDNDPNGASPYLGLGEKKDEPLYVRIKVE